jgi:DNA-binding GntR family transcriptional regulator
MQIEYPSLSDRVYEYLSKQIIEGNIKYGEKLNIKVISEQLNVSTMPVRDALKKLEMENIVRIKPRSNCIVAVPTKKSILDAAEMRELLELHAAKLIYRTITASELRPINEIVGNMEKLTKGSPTKDQTNRYIYLDLLFHTELCNLAGNEYLIKFYREVNLHLNMTFIYRIGTPPDIHESFKDHKRFVENLAENSPESLNLLEAHLERSKNHIVQGKLFQSLE